MRRPVLPGGLLMITWWKSLMMVPEHHPGNQAGRFLMAVLRVPWNIRQALVCSVQQAPGGWQVSLWKAVPVRPVPDGLTACSADVKSEQQNIGQQA